MKDFKKFEEIFEEYTNRYINKEDIDEGRKLNFSNKKIHSYHVRDNILEIAKAENLKVDMFIVEFIGLFHDIGRFYQYDKYETFNDAKSQNHAKLTIKVLEDEGILNIIDYEDRPYVVDAILMHNLQDLPRLKDKKMYLYAALLRDADKLDGFRSISVAESKDSVYFKNKSDAPIISDRVYESILNKKSVYKYDLTTILESQIVALGYITSDINFRTTLKLIKENDYTKKMFEKMQDTPMSRKIYNFVNEYIDRRLCNEEE
ncbi:MAG: HD domain-containing protein [Clostridia bacterium]|nr:HD domain-containing protein [Clostridia bacterium]